MRGMWVKVSGLAVMVLALGCRTQVPNLKPPPAQEAFNAPPSEKRFNTSDYPKEAFNNRDPLRKVNPDQDIVPVRGPGANLTGVGAGR